jgi:Outer membrane protein beta-barrel domain
MKKLKFMLMAVLVAASFLSTQAQGVILRGGVNFQNLNGKDADGKKDNGKLKAGFNLGAVVEIPLAPDFYLQPGLLYSTKGSKNDDEFLGQKISSKLNLGYLEVPIHFIHKPVLGNGHLILGLGPYIGFGLNGKFSLEFGGDKTESDVKFKNTVKASDSNEYAYVKRLDAGANLLAGYEFANGLSFQLNTQLGLLNIAPDYEGATNDESKTSNTGFGLSLGYRFGG